MYKITLMISSASLEAVLRTNWQLRWILKQLFWHWLKSQCGEINILCTWNWIPGGINSQEMVTNPRVARCKQYAQFKCPKEVKQHRHFLGMVQHYHDCWARRNNCLPVSLHLRVWSDQSNQCKRNQKDTLALEQGPSKSIQSLNGYYDKRSSLGLSRLF